MDFKAFFSSPQGAAAVVGLIRAALMAAVGFGAAFTQPQIDSLVMTVTAAMVVLSLVFTGVTVSTVAKRADQEEADAAVSGKVLADNQATASPDA